VPKRRADWLVGRIAAKSVVAAALADVVPAEWPLAALEIASEPSGMPYARVAPEAGAMARFGPGERLPISISISHAAGHALCAATWSAPSGDGVHPALGIDLGVVEPRSREFVETFFTDDEQRFVRRAAPWEHGERANLVWCAKEAVLKALGVGLTVDTFHLSCLPAAEVANPAEWALSPAAGGDWSAFVATCSAALVPGGGTVRGIWRAFPGFVGALALSTKGLSPA
jgi:phosphopantetheinyl transferase